MNQNQLFEFFIDESQKPFTGWDFSYIEDTGRLDSEPLEWSYASYLLPYLRQAQTMLDMGTGGGEFLTALQPLPQDTHATEGYAPNFPIARRNLKPLGVNVRMVENDETLPFDDHQFDVIINRHESYYPWEVFRILKDDGQFITQQVGGSDMAELNEWLGADKDDGFSHWNLDYAEKELKKAGFHIIKKYEQFPYTRFYDVGAIVYYLKAISWQIPDFSVEKYMDQLYELHRTIMEKGYIQFKSHRFFIAAEKAQVHPKE